MICTRNLLYAIRNSVRLGEIQWGSETCKLQPLNISFGYQTFFINMTMNKHWHHWEHRHLAWPGSVENIAAQDCQCVLLPAVYIHVNIYILPLGLKWHRNCTDAHLPALAWWDRARSQRLVSTSPKQLVGLSGSTVPDRGQSSRRPAAVWVASLH